MLSCWGVRRWTRFSVSERKEMSKGTVLILRSYLQQTRYLKYLQQKPANPRVFVHTVRFVVRPVPPPRPIISLEGVSAKLKVLCGPTCCQNSV